MKIRHGSRKTVIFALLSLLLLPAFATVKLRGAPIPAARHLPVHAARPLPTQAPFLLLAVTHISDRFGFLTPPAIVTAMCRDEQRINTETSNEPVMALSEGTGLWIEVPSGVGYRVITVANDRQRHTYPIGLATLAVNETYPLGYSVGWTAADGHSSLPEGQRPYETNTTWIAKSAEHLEELAVTLIPNRLSLPFDVTAQPLTQTGKTLGRPVSLVCQVVNRTTVFAQIPTGYNAATQQIQVSVMQRSPVARVVSWRVTNIPGSVKNGGDTQATVVTAQAGPVTIWAAAAEAEDFCGNSDFSNRHPERDAGEGWTFDQPLNGDGHGWTGVPSIRFLLTAHNASHDFRGQDWVVRLNRVTPQWSSSLPQPKLASIMPLDVFPVYSPQYLPPNKSWVTHDWQVGAAYPGQQHWVRIEGDMIRSRHRVETVTFHDADIVHDTVFGGDRVVWQHPETETTPSGISVTVLNAQPGVHNQSPAPSYAPDWRFDRGSAELLLAWHLPLGITSQEHAPLDAEVEAAPPNATGLLKSEWDSQHPLLNTKALVLPGANSLLGGNNAVAVPRNATSQFRLTVSSTVPPDFPHLPHHEGLFQVPPTPLPRHLKTVTFQVWLKERLEVHPFQLVVPVHPSFPPGWNPDGADGRSKTLVAQGNHR